MVTLAESACSRPCLCQALKKHPNFNAVIDDKARALDVYESIHLGVAVDSDDGLLVPVIRDAGDKSVDQLAHAIGATAEEARSGALAVSDFPAA